MKQLIPIFYNPFAHSLHNTFQMPLFTCFIRVNKLFKFPLFSESIE